MWQVKMKKVGGASNEIKQEYVILSQSLSSLHWHYSSTFPSRWLQPHLAGLSMVLPQPATSRRTCNKCLMIQITRSSTAVCHRDTTQLRYPTNTSFLYISTITTTTTTCPLTFLLYSTAGTSKIGLKLPNTRILTTATRLSLCWFLFLLFLFRSVPLLIGKYSLCNGTSLFVHFFYVSSSIFFNHL